MTKTITGMAFAAMLLAHSFAAEAQQSTKMPRIGYLSAVFTTGSPRDSAFLQGLRELGYVEGKNIFIEYRYGDQQRKDNGLPELAAELVRLKVDIIVALDPPSARAAKKSTSVIPIVMRAFADPVREGLVASIARPGGNITGLYSVSEELIGKRLELLKELNSRLARVAILRNLDFANSARIFKDAEMTAKSLGLQLQPLDVRVADDFDRSFQVAKKNHAEAVITIRTPLMVAERKRISALAIKSRLPAIYDDREFVEAGGLMSYGANLEDLYKRAATYVGKILKGAKPTDLPVEQPTKFELVINLKAAKQIGLTIPQSVLYRADKVIR